MNGRLQEDAEYRVRTGLFETQIVILTKIYGRCFRWNMDMTSTSQDDRHQQQVFCFNACVENGSRLHCACKGTPTLIGGQANYVLSYDAFWGMTPAVLEPDCRCTPLSARGLGTDAATSCLIGAVKHGCRQPGPGSQSRATAALGTTDALYHTA